MHTYSGIELTDCPGTYTIHRLHPDRKIPVISHGFHNITRTGDEISVVCLEEIDIRSEKRSSGWKCLRVSGTLDLGLTGILHDITRPLKKAGISVFVISTFDTDYLLVPGKSYTESIRILSKEFRVLSG